MQIAAAAVTQCQSQVEVRLQGTVVKVRADNGTLVAYRKPIRDTFGNSMRMQVM